MKPTVSHSDLSAYLDEALAADQMSAIEEALRTDPEVVKMLSAVSSRRDAGVHSLGEIWRKHQVSCISRDRLGSFLLNALDEEEAEYVRFHLEVIKCRLCTANYEDLHSQQAESSDRRDSRRRKYFQSSAGYLGNSY